MESYTLGAGMNEFKIKKGGKPKRRSRKIFLSERRTIPWYLHI
jgi:hypothetical protein